jgi:hypothetical protein
LTVITLLRTAYAKKRKPHLIFRRVMNIKQMDECSAARHKNYAKTRLHLLELFIELDKLIPPGPTKERTLRELVDTSDLIVYAYQRG